MTILAGCSDCRPATFGVFLCPACVEHARVLRAAELAAARGPEERDPPGPAGPPPQRERFTPDALPDRTAALRALVIEVAEQTGRPELVAPDSMWPQVLRRLELSMGGLYFPASERPNRMRVGLRWLMATSKVRLEPVPELADDLTAAGVTIPGGVWSLPSMTTPADAQDPGGFVTGIDVNAMWPNAAQMVKLGSGRPELVEDPGPDIFRLPGFFLIDHDPYWPAPFREMPAGRWIPAPLAALLAESHQGPVRARLGLIWREHRLWLRTFAQTALRAREKLAGPDPTNRTASAALKAIINPAVDGVLRSEQWNRTAWCRPDWAEQVRALAAANMWRHLYRAPRSPTAQATDAAYYVTPTLGERPPIPDPKTGPVFSTQPGRFKIHRAVPYTDDMRAAAAAGRADHFQTLVSREAAPR